MQEITIYTRKEWRDWLSKNHDKESKVAIIIHKKHTGKPSISHRESMEEAICFGWIDTTLKRLDEDRYVRNFAKRTDKSRWSNNTLSYAKDMIKKRLMTSAGLKRYKEGLKKPSLDLNLPENHIPKELKKEFEKSKKFKDAFEHIAPSMRKMFVHMLERAKLPETKKKRIMDIKRYIANKTKPQVNTAQNVK